MKFECLSTDQSNLSKGKIYEGNMSECGCAFEFKDDDGDHIYWTINDYSTKMIRVE